VSQFSSEEAEWIREAAGMPDTDRALEMLREHFGGFRLVSAAKETDRLSAEPAAMPAARAKRIREAVAAAVRDAGVAPAVDRTQVLESYEDGTVLMRDCGSELTGCAVGTVDRDRS
jgi:hypothetical protein